MTDSSESAQQKISRFLRSEVALGTLIGLLSILTAFASYQSSLAGGDESDANVEGQAILADSNAEYLRANQLLVSGTASVVGHVSRHAGDSLAQVDETLVNLEHLFAAAGHALDGHDAARTLLKVYLRDPGDAAAVEQRIRARHPHLAGLLMLAGDICRRELRVEIDGIDG